MADQAIDKRRLADLLSRDDVVEGKPDYWYGVVDGFGGSLWPTLFIYRKDAAKCAKELQGTVVIVAARILEDGDGEHIEPEN